MQTQALLPAAAPPALQHSKLAATIQHSKKTQAAVCKKQTTPSKHTKPALIAKASYTSYKIIIWLQKAKSLKVLALECFDYHLA